MIPRRALTWMVAVGVCLLLATTAQAQLLTLTPSVTVGEEFNDNISLVSQGKESDFITTISPGISLSLDSGSYHLLGRYSFTSEIYAKHSEFDDAIARQSLALNGSWNATPTLTLALTEVFTLDNQTNVVSPEGLSGGRTSSWSNDLAPTVTWQVTPLTALNFGGDWTMQRYSRGNLSGSNLYRIDAGVTHAFTPRFSGILLYQLGFIDVENEPLTITHTPRVGATYRITETLTATGSAGPSIVTDGGTRVTPAASVSLTQRLFFGSASISYDRSVGTGGPFGGTTDNQNIGGTLAVTTLMRGLTLGLSPRYTTSKSSDNSVDVNAFNLGLSATYQFNRWITAVANYSFFTQHNSAAVVNEDIDQNRVSIGLQFGYPIKFD